jgi:hypothetical protein
LNEISKFVKSWHHLNSSFSHTGKNKQKYDKKYFCGCHDALKIFGAPKLCTVMYWNHCFLSPSRISQNKLRRPSIQKSMNKVLLILLFKTSKRAKTLKRHLKKTSIFFLYKHFYLDWYDFYNKKCLFDVNVKFWQFFSCFPLVPLWKLWKKSCLNELKFWEASRNCLWSICWKFQQSISLGSKKSPSTIQPG